MKRPVTIFLVFLFLCIALSQGFSQTYYYDGGTITQSDLNRARPYKKGTYLLQGGKNRGVIWIPKHDSRGKHYLKLFLEHFLQGAGIQDYTPIQVDTIVGGSHGIASVFALLMDVDARKLLEISDEQGDQINILFAEFRNKVGWRMQELQHTQPRMPAFQMALVRLSEIEHQSVTMGPMLEQVLTPKQFQRSKEIVFQLSGGFNSPVVDLSILSLFNLTREQRDKLELIAEDANQKRDKVFAARNNAQLGVTDMQAFDNSMAEVSAIISRKVRAVLTPEQLDKGNQLMEEMSETVTLLRISKG